MFVLSAMARAIGGDISVCRFSLLPPCMSLVVHLLSVLLFVSSLSSACSVWREPVHANGIAGLSRDNGIVSIGVVKDGSLQ